MNIKQFKKKYPVKVSLKEKKQIQIYSDAFMLTIELLKKINWKKKEYDGPWLEQEIIKLLDKMRKL